MRVMNLITECTRYAIISHQDFWCEDIYGEARAKFVDTMPPLECNTSKSGINLEKRHGIDASLAKSFVRACHGDDARWKLIRVVVESGILSLAFADTQADKIDNESSDYYPIEVVNFGPENENPAFTVCIKNDDGSIKKSYNLLCTGHDRKKIGKRNMSNMSVIVEERCGEQILRCGTISLADDGKYYFDHDIYDYS